MDIPKFVTSQPALLLGNTLIISDLHLGIEYGFYKSGINIPSQTEKLFDKLAKLIKKTKARKLIILGDIKHKVPGTSWQEEREIPIFFSRLLKMAEVEIVMGNHDPGIEDMVPDGVKIHPTEGFLFEKFYLTHGHAWPSQDLKKADYIITGHNQPLIEIKDKLGHSWVEKAWISTKLSRKKLTRYKGIKTPPELIIMPAFNDLAGGIRFNQKKEFMGPITKAAIIKSAKVYLLDGTFLGELKNL